MYQTFYDSVKALPQESFSNGKVSFRLIRDEEDLAYVIFFCELKEDQIDLVNPGGFSIGRAYLKPGDNYPCVICAEDGRRIGFINLCTWLGNDSAVSWGYYLDRNEQGKGYGRAAAELAISVLKKAFPGQMLKGAVEAGNAHAQRLYKSLGLCQLDELDGDDLVFGMKL